MKSCVYVMWDEVAEQLVSRPSFFPNDDTAIREFCNGAKEAKQIEDINLYRLGIQVDLDSLKVEIMESLDPTLVFQGVKLLKEEE